MSSDYNTGQRIRVDDQSSQPCHNDETTFTGAPIHRAPDDILIDILLSILSNPISTTRRERVLLMLTCKRWSDLIFATPSFWQSILIHPGLVTNEGKDQLERLLKLSGSTPLNITVDFGRESDEIPAVIPGDLEFLFATFGRWRALTLSGDGVRAPAREEEGIHGFLTQMSNFLRKSGATTFSFLHHLKLTKMHSSSVKLFTSLSLSLPSLITLQLSHTRLSTVSFQELLSPTRAPNRTLYLGRIDLDSDIDEWGRAPLMKEEAGRLAFKEIVADDRHLPLDHRTHYRTAVHKEDLGVILGGLLLHLPKVHHLQYLTGPNGATMLGVSLRHWNESFRNIKSLGVIIDLVPLNARAITQPAQSIPHLPNLQVLTHECRGALSTETDISGMSPGTKASSLTSTLGASIKHFRNQVPGTINIIDYPLEFASFCEVLEVLESIDAGRFNGPPLSVAGSQASPVYKCQLSLLRCSMIREEREDKKLKPISVKWNHLSVRCMDVSCTWKVIEMEDELVRWAKENTPGIKVVIR